MASRSTSALSRVLPEDGRFDAETMVIDFVATSDASPALVDAIAQRRKGSWMLNTPSPSLDGGRFPMPRDCFMSLVHLYEHGSITAVSAHRTAGKRTNGQGCETLALLVALGAAQTGVDWQKPHRVGERCEQLLARFHVALSDDPDLTWQDPDLQDMLGMAREADLTGTWVPVNELHDMLDLADPDFEIEHGLFHEVDPIQPPPGSRWPETNDRSWDRIRYENPGIRQGQGCLPFHDRARRRLA